MAAREEAGALSPGRLIDASGVSYDSVSLALASAMDAELASFSGVTTPFSGLCAAFASNATDLSSYPVCETGSAHPWC